MAGTVLTTIGRIGVFGMLVLGLCWSRNLDAAPLAMAEIAPGIFVHQGEHAEATPENRGDIANIGFIVGDDAVAVIDTGGSPTMGRRLREAIRQHTDKPIRYVINTHMHPDHVFGNAAFLQDYPVFIGHANLRGALMARADTYMKLLESAVGPDELAEAVMTAPDEAVQDRKSIDLGGRILDLTAWPTAHTNNDLTVFDRRTRTLWAADLVFATRTPSLDGSLLGWIKVMAQLAALPAARVVPGHGAPVLPWPAAMNDQQRYFSKLVEGIKTVQRRGGTIADAVATTAQDERRRWALFDDYNPRNVTTAFAELEWE